MRDVKRLAAKYWHVAASLLMVAMSVGVQKQRFTSYGQRLDAVEAAKPDVTAALTQRTADEVAGLRSELHQVSGDVGAIKVDVAKIAVRLEMQPIRDGAQLGGTNGVGR